MNAELFTLLSGGLGYLAKLVAEGAISRIGEGMTEGLANLLHEAARNDPTAQVQLETFAEEPDDERNRERLAQRLATSLEDNTAAVEQLTALLHDLQAAYGQAQPLQDRSINVFDQGQVGTAITGDIAGNLTLGPTIFGSRPAAPSPVPPATPPDPPAVPASLPQTLSADGIHFSYGHALLIGVGSYARWGYSVPTTANNAQQLAAVLRDPAYAAYLPEQVQPLSNKAATRTGMLAALDRLIERVRTSTQPVRPTVVLFFAGHGVQSECTWSQESGHIWEAVLRK